MNVDLCSCFNVYKLKEAVMDVALKDYEAKEDDAKANGIGFRAVESLVLLETVDAKWIDHIESMDVLRRGIGLRGLGQRDPVIAYRQEGWDMFDDMVNSIHTGTASTLMKLPYYSETVEKRKKKEEQMAQARNVAKSQSNTRNFVRNKKH